MSTSIDKGSVLIKAVEVLGKPLHPIDYKNCNHCDRRLSPQMRKRKHLKIAKKYIYVCKYGCINNK